MIGPESSVHMALDFTVTFPVAGDKCERLAEFLTTSRIDAEVETVSTEYGRGKIDYS
jgi:hypothetical protein